MKQNIDAFSKGVHNLLKDDIIPKDASSGSLNWITQEGRIKLIGGRQRVGVEGAVGHINALWVGYTTKSVKVLYRKTATKLQYLLGTTWTDILTGLTDTEFSCANYSSLAGAFTFFNGTDGFYVINNANPGSSIELYAKGGTYTGHILIDRGRCILWNRDKDKTGLYGSWIDRQNATVYTQVTNEAIGALGSTHYTGTLAFKAAGAKRHSFAVSFSGAYATGTELFTDNYDGTLTGNHGGTGTIKYITGVYDITFGAITTGAVTSSYQWQDFSVKGLADFSKTATRLAGEGFQFPQDEGGDAILNVLVGQDGAYYSIKSQSAYRLEIESTDLNATNIVYRKELGLANWRCAVSTAGGIVFVNTANPLHPILTILRKNQFDNVEPYPICPHFRFADYDFSESSMETYERYVTICCKTKGADANDVILFVNVADQSVDIVKYEAKMTAKDGIKLYCGSSISQDVYEILAGFDDEDLAIQNEWKGKGETFGTSSLKKEKKLRFDGVIDIDQSVEVWCDIDDSGYALVGLIDGHAGYVDYANPQTIGVNFIGGQQLGGDDTISAYPFRCEIRIKVSKFNKRNLKFVAKGIGYVEISAQEDVDVLLFENRLNKKYRTKRV